MKIGHSIIALISLIFVTGSMLTVSMNLKTTTNISMNLVGAKKKYYKNKEADLIYAQKHEETMNEEARLKEEKINQAKAIYKMK